MLRVLLKIGVSLWLFAIISLFIMLSLGKTAPDVSTIAFFSQEIGGTDYWRVDLFTGVAFKDSYSPRILVSSIDSYAFNPLLHFLTLENQGDEYAIYEVNLETQERQYIHSYPNRNNYIVLEGDYLFIVDFTGGNYDWTRIDLLSGENSSFLENTSLESPEISPDGRWLAGIKRHEHIVINMETASSYELSGYCCILWSPDSQWYIAAHENSAGLISVVSANGAAHPLLPESFLAPMSRWSNDSQSIIFQNGNRLASVSLQTGEILEYPTEAQSFHSDCFAPNQKYIIGYNETELILLDVETGAELWRLNHDFSGLPACFWSEDSRYLAMHISARELDALGNLPVYWQRFVFIDTQTGNHWSLYPEILPTMPFYTHIPD